MNENFIPDEVVDDFSSVVWVERYAASGEVQLVAPAYPEYVDMLKEGRYLGMSGTKEVMEIKTQSVEQGLITVVGRSLLAFLAERIHWPKSDPANASQPVADYTTTAKIGELLADRVTKMVIAPVAFTGATFVDMNLDWNRDKIAHLTLGAVDSSGVAERYTVPVGPLYDVIQQLAEKEGVGISLYLATADAEVGYELKFTTYRGVDRTSGQSVVPLIRLSPSIESIGELKEVKSIDGYKNVVYVVYQNKVSIHYEDPENIPEGLHRRVLVTNAEGEPVGHKAPRQFMGSGLVQFGSYGGGGGGSGAGLGNFAAPYLNTDNPYTVVTAPDPGEIAAFRAQNAKDALANHNYIRAVDGQVSPINEYKFGKDYGLGDILELEGLTGVIGKARVTEYIRAQDNTGQREYPTLSVIQ